MAESSDFKIEEYKALRSEIEKSLSELTTLEHHCSMGAAIIYSWIATASVTAEIQKYAWFIPVLLPIYGAARSGAVGIHLLLIGRYIRRHVEPEIGWEHFFEKNGKDLTTRVRKAFWFVFILISIFCSIIGYIATGKNSSNQEKVIKSEVTLLSKPFDFRLNIDGYQFSEKAASTPTKNETNRVFLDSLANLILNALQTASGTIKDTSSLASVAANEFVKGFFGKAGEKAGEDIVEFFTKLIEQGFDGKDNNLTNEKRSKLIELILNEIIKNKCPIVDIPHAKNDVFIEQALFSSNKANLTFSALKAIDKVKDFNNKHPTSEFCISSYTDTTGSKTRNTQLALQRGKLIGDLLMDQASIQQNRITYNYFATKNIPISTFDNSDEPLNRIVTIEAKRCVPPNY